MPITVSLEHASFDRNDLDLQALRSATGELILHERSEPTQAPARLAGADVAIVNKLRLDAGTLAACPDLRLILVAATGTDNVDLRAAAAQGIAVANCRGYGTASVAQHTLMLMLALHTGFAGYQVDVAAGLWSRADGFCLYHRPIAELAGKTLGLLGHGELGRAVGLLAQAFGMRVRIGRLPGRPGGPERVPFGQLLGEADVLSLHCPLTPQTRHLIDADALACMKPGAFLINTARGGLVDPQALAVALRSGHLGGAGIDVLETEPPPADHPLLAPGIPNLILTPHNAWASREARQRILDQLAENLRAWRAGTPIRLVTP